MNRIPSNVPVFIKDIEQQDDGMKTYTKAKLKVFYIGETPDHRLFTKDFSDKVIQTLPLTPVVGFYSEEDEDFKGHNNIQYVYGVVPDAAEMSYEKDEDSGNTFFVTDVILYTERKDNIGKVANKIIGKQHSLELDPDSLKYKINRDNQGRFMNIEFLEGKFVGLSVLGDNETPAFTGSGFFSINKDLELVTECKDKFDKFLNLLNNNGGNIEVFNSENFFNAMKETFAKISMQEFQTKIYAALESAGKYGWLVENTEDYAIVSTWNEEENRSMYIKYSISLVDDAIVLGECVEVKATYLTQEELNALDSANATATDPVVNEEDKEDDKKDDDANCADNTDDEDDKKEDDVDAPNCAADDKKDDEEDSKPACAEDDKKDEEDDKTAVCVENDDDKKDEDGDDKQGDYLDVPADDKDDKKDDEDDFSANTQTEGAINNASQSIVKEQEDDEQVGTSAASASATTLSDSEKAELENYRREEKQRMISEYKGELSDEILDNFKNNIDSFTKEQLEAKLAIEFRKFKKSVNDETNKTITAFSILTSANNSTYDETNAADVINKYAKKK
jgi:hypothetical protein